MRLAFPWISSRSLEEKIATEYRGPTQARARTLFRAEHRLTSSDASQTPAWPQGLWALHARDEPGPSWRPSTVDEDASASSRVFS